MRIRVAPSRRRLDRVTINLASMIDVTFLLLFYFMAATMLDNRETRLSSGLQTEAKAGQQASDFQPQSVQVIMVDGSPAYRIGSTVARSRDELRAALEPLHKPTGLFVKVAEGVPVGFAVAAVQIGRDVGFEQVTYVPLK
jgi:biopolymer transport protein ExbD